MKPTRILSVTIAIGCILAMAPAHAGPPPPPPPPVPLLIFEATGGGCYLYGEAAKTVVGGGVVGLTAALRLAESGHDVRCVRDVAASRTVSAVAGGLWFPYHVHPRDRVVRWGLRSLERFRALAEDPATGVALRDGVLVERSDRDRWWTEGVGSWREARPDELPDGASSDRLPRGSVELKNDSGRSRYTGPCPPIGRHRYVHKLYALDSTLGGVEQPTNV